MRYDLQTAGSLGALAANGLIFGFVLQMHAVGFSLSDRSLNPGRSSIPYNDLIGDPTFIDMVECAVDARDIPEKFLDRVYTNPPESRAEGLDFIECSLFDHNARRPIWMRVEDYQDMMLGLDSPSLGKNEIRHLSPLTVL